MADSSRIPANGPFGGSAAVRDGFPTRTGKLEQRHAPARPGAAGPTDEECQSWASDSGRAYVADVAPGQRAGGRAAIGFSTEVADERPIDLFGRSVRFPPRPGGGRASERGKRILELDARTGVPSMGFINSVLSRSLTFAGVSGRRCVASGYPSHQCFRSGM